MLEFTFTMETYVFEELLKNDQGSNDIPSLSIHYSKPNLQIKCQGR